MPYPHGIKTHKRKLQSTIGYDFNLQSKAKSTYPDLMKRDLSKKGVTENRMKNSSSKGYSKASRRIGGYNERPILSASSEKYGKAKRTLSSVKRNMLANTPYMDLVRQVAGKGSKLSSTARKALNDYTLTGGPNTYYQNGSMAGSGSVAGSALGSSNLDYWKYMEYLSDKNTATNIFMNRENNRFAADQAKLQRNWEQEMSSTAHQREVKDLQAAGLNPVLSANAGAAVPSGAAAGATNFNGADSSAVSAMAGIVEAALSANAVTTAAGMSLAGQIYSSDNALRGSMYSADTSYNAQQEANKYGLVGDVIRLIGTISGGVAGYKGITQAAKTERRSSSVSRSVSRNYNYNWNSRG